MQEFRPFLLLCFLRAGVIKGSSKHTGRLFRFGLFEPGGENPEGCWGQMLREGSNGENMQSGLQSPESCVFVKCMFGLFVCFLTANGIQAQLCESISK